MVNLRNKFSYNSGDTLVCKEDVVMNNSNKTVEFTKGKVYKSEFDGCLTNNSGDRNHIMGPVSVSKYFYHPLDIHRNERLEIILSKTIDNLK